MACFSMRDCSGTELFKGTETSIYLASSSGVEGITEKYFINKKEAKSSK